MSFGHGGDDETRCLHAYAPSSNDRVAIIASPTSRGGGPPDGENPTTETAVPHGASQGRLALGTGGQAASGTKLADAAKGDQAYNQNAEFDRCVVFWQYNARSRR